MKSSKQTIRKLTQLKMHIILTLILYINHEIFKDKDNI